MPLSGSGLTLAIMFNLFWFDIGFMWTKWMYPIGLVLRPLLLLLACFINICGWIFEKAIPSTQMSFNHITIGRQPERIAEDLLADRQNLGFQRIDATRTASEVGANE